MGTEDIVFGPQSPAAIQRKIEMAKAAGKEPPTFPPPSTGSPPSITAVTPSAGPDQTEVVITGTYFQMQGASSQVTVGGQAAVVLGWTDTELTLVAVQGSSQPGFPLPVQVTAADGQTSAVDPAPSFTFEEAARVGGKFSRSGPTPAGKKSDLSLG